VPRSSLGRAVRPVAAQLPCADMTPAELVTAALVGRLATSATTLTTTLLGPGIQSRAIRRTITAQERASAAALDRRRQEIEAEQVAAESGVIRRRQQIEIDLIHHREVSMDARYALGQPGRLRALPPNGVAPCLLVSPTKRLDPLTPLTIADIVSDVVQRVDSSGHLVRPVTGAFAWDEGRPREIEGNVAAAEVALLEFSPRPSIIVHFGGAGEALTAHAHISHVVRTTENEPTFDTPVARLVRNQLEFAIWRMPGEAPGPDLEWRRQEVDAPDADPYVAFGTAIALSALAICLVYWGLQGVRWRLDRPSLEPLNEMFDAAAQLVTSNEGRIIDDVTLSERMCQELAELTASHTGVDVFDWEGDETIGVYVPRPPRAITFVVPRDYPTSPPEILMRDGQGAITEIRLESSQWNPSCSLIELLEALG
jgi:hypothetical protein